MASTKNLLVGLFVALLAAAAFAASCPGTPTCSGIQGHCDANFTSGNSYCACRSGYSGDDCSSPVVGCDSQFNNITDLNTDYAPISVAVSFAADVLTVGIASPLVAQRNYTLIAVDDSVFNKDSCSYPGLYWSRSFDSCHDVFTGAMPWANNTLCGWTNDNSGASLSVYSAQMIVEHHDFTDPFINRTGGATVERITQHRVPLTLSFPKNISVSSQITVQSPVRLLASISRQTVSADGNTAVIDITTNLLWPYILSNFSIPTHPGLVSYTPSLVSSNCVNDTTSSCTQIFRITIATGAPAGDCNLNGAYSLLWTIECQPFNNAEPAKCAIQIGDTISANLNVVSENFCTVISTTTPLTGSLTTFGDLAQSRPKTQFLVGQTLYYHAAVVATNVTLTGTSINSVKLSDGVNPDILLFSGGQAAPALTSAGEDASFTIGAAAAAYADFHYTLNATYIAALADDSSRVYTTLVIVDVDYQDVVTRKRGVRSVAFQSTLNTQAVGLSASVSVTPDQSTSAPIAAVAAPLALAGAAFAALN